MALEDFVNREEHLTTILDAIGGRNEPLLLLAGESGIGKSYLLEECRAHCQREGISHFWIDLADANSRDYLSIVQSVRRQLGFEHFTRLNDELAMVGQRAGPVGTVRSLPTGRQPSHEAGRSGGVHISDSTVTVRDIAGRDINYITQVIHGDDPFVQMETRERISASWQSCLQELADLAPPLVCFVDSWEEATADIEAWIKNVLFDPIISGNLRGIVVIVAGQTVPRLGRRPGRILALNLTSLPSEAVRQYWVTRRGLDAEEWEHVFRLSRGQPHLVAALADLQTFSVT